MPGQPLPLLLAPVLLPLLCHPVECLSCHQGSGSSSQCSSQSQNSGVWLPLGVALLGQVFSGFLGQQASGNTGEQTHQLLELLPHTTLSDDQFQNSLVSHLRQKLNIDVNSFWVQTVLQLVEHDVNDNCYITYGGLTRLLALPLQGYMSVRHLLRSCPGAWLWRWTRPGRISTGQTWPPCKEAVTTNVQANPYMFWTTSVCFPRPGSVGQEVCSCRAATEDMLPQS